MQGDSNFTKQPFIKLSWLFFFLKSSSCTVVDFKHIWDPLVGRVKKKNESVVAHEASFSI